MQYAYRPQLNDFKALPKAARDTLLASSQGLVLAKGTVLYRENQKLTQLYTIISGACKYSRFDQAGNEHLLRFLASGDVLGKRAILKKNESRVSAITLCKTELCCIDNTILERFAKDSPEFYKILYSAIVEDLAETEENRIRFGQNKSIKNRLANLLLYLEQKFGITTEGKLTVRVKRDDMAVTIGTSPEYVINVLKLFKKEGIVDVIRGEVYILSLSKLKVTAAEN